MTDRQTFDPGTQLDTDNPGEVTYSCDQLGVSRERLQETVNRVGNRIADVLAHLGKLDPRND
jgi:hypothetical protein